MNVEQRRWTKPSGWIPASVSAAGPGSTLVLVFGSTSLMSSPERLEEVRRAFPGALLLGCSTAGEIFGTQVADDSLVATAMHFESTRIRGARIRLADAGSSAEAGERLSRELIADDLAHVFVLSDGLKVNGSELVAGMARVLPSSVAVTGGLSGDGVRFQQTLVCLDGPAEEGWVAGVGFYGANLRIGYGSVGGWDAFGPDRLVTRSRGNILYEVDGRSALELYKTYLGDHAKDLPASGLLFPLSLRVREGDTGVVRTILGVDEAAGSMTFAGDIPEGAWVRLMKANFDRLIDGAMGAARTSLRDASAPDAAILISCVGRKLILKQRIEEEVEGVQEILGPRPVMTGFYSYGEISPFTPGAKCELHNQTMTVTTFREAA